MWNLIRLLVNQPYIDYSFVLTSYEFSSNILISLSLSLCRLRHIISRFNLSTESSKSYYSDPSSVYLLPILLYMHGVRSAPYQPLLQNWLFAFVSFVIQVRKVSNPLHNREELLTHNILSAGHLCICSP